MKRKSVALYNPFLDTLGGGEKHTLSILKVFDELDFEINIFWDKNLQKEIHQRFSLQYSNKLNWLPNTFVNKRSITTKLVALKNFDILLYVTDGSYFVSTAKKNFIFCMIPDKKLYNFGLKNKLKTLNYKFITNSKFTQNWLQKWNINSEVIYPYINEEFVTLNINKIKKEKIILSIGRFYSHLHTKKHSILINLFKKLKQTNSQLKDFKLIIAGGLKKEDKNYFNELKKLIKNKNEIILKPNISFNELSDLYKKSLIYIHMTGYGIDENKYPESVEHFGISPVEAMAAGCFTFCYKAGGPKEIINNQMNGFLFTTERDLQEQIGLILINPNLQYQIRTQAKKYIVDNFSYAVFAKRVKEVFL